MALEKALIEVLAGSTGPRRIAVLFNPAEYSIERANVYKSTPIPSLGGPLIQFVNGDAATLSMDLFLDDFTDPDGPPEESPGVAARGERKSVQQRIDELTGLLDIQADLHAPPPVQFVWGKLRFTAVIEKIGRKVTMSHPTGIPARATLSVSFREYRPLKQLARLESTDKTKRRQVDAAETIWLIAHEEYGDVKRYRLIAQASDVDEPRDLVPGDWLKLPPLEDGDAGKLTL